jgi:hypothetical protein
LSTPGQRVVDLAGWGLGAVLAAVAASRGGKAVHPVGAVHRARLVIGPQAGGPPGSALLSTPAEHQAIARFSRSLGLPRRVPDLLGISLRVMDAYGSGRHQDVLMVSSVDLPVLHHFFVPATDFQQRPYSSSLPYRAGSDTFLLGAVPVPGAPRPSGGDELDRLDKAAATGRLVFDLAVAPVGGRFRRVGALHIDARLPDIVDALRFNPFNCGGGLEPVGVLNRLRDYAYPLSQGAWGRRHGRRRAQDGADATLRALFPSGDPAPEAQGV